MTGCKCPPRTTMRGEQVVELGEQEWLRQASFRMQCIRGCRGRVMNGIGRGVEGRSFRLPEPLHQKRTQSLRPPVAEAKSANGGPRDRPTGPSQTMGRGRAKTAKSMVINCAEVLPWGMWASRGGWRGAGERARAHLGACSGGGAERVAGPAASRRCEPREPWRMPLAASGSPCHGLAAC